MTIPTREEVLTDLDSIDAMFDALNGSVCDEHISRLRSYIESHTGEVVTHEWHERFGLMCCKVCGFVRNENSDTKGCRGPVYVSLRDASLVQPDADLTEALTRIEELEGALGFYAEGNNWRSPSSGFALQYDPEPSPINKDRGKIALATLTQGINE